jgi:uncharacterized protein
MLERFWDEGRAIFFDTPADGEELVIRPRDFFDNATPSGNSAAVTALLRLAALLGEERYERVAVRVMSSMAGLLSQMPEGFGELLCAVEFHLAPAREVVIVGRRGEPGTETLLDVVRSMYLPEVVVAFRDAAEPGDPADQLLLLRGREEIEGAAAAYVCRRFTCGLPATDAAGLREQLSGPW